MERYEGGVWAHLYELFADGAARLQKERSEMVIAAARCDEALALRDDLRAQLARCDARVAELAGADADLAAARRAKESALIASGSPAGDELESISEELGRLDVDGRALAEAVQAGERAMSLLRQLASVLSTAHSWGTWDALSSNSMISSWVKRNELDTATRLAGQVQAQLRLFQRELGDLGETLEAELGALAGHDRLLDVWFDNLFTDLGVLDRIEDAQASTHKVGAAVRGSVAALQVRSRALAEHCATLTAARHRHLDPA